mmetsp:Transcript_75221/g.178744  ORF Transcript_75221/g.178744 Transcript_75221/m.178744 type:complete len:360 (+) Transcript_75221:88-1167(+)
MGLGFSTGFSTWFARFFGPWSRQLPDELPKTDGKLTQKMQVESNSSQDVWLRGVTVASEACNINAEGSILHQYNWGSQDGLDGLCSTVGVRDKQEDVVVTKEYSNGVIVHAVLDGHGGTAAVLHLKLLIEERIRSIADLRQEVFDEIDEAIISRLREETSEASLSSGAVCVIAVREGNRIGIANIGDCVALLSKGQMEGEDLISTVVKLTEDHNLKNAAELSRLQAEGHTVSGGYLYDSLEVSRAFGDIEFASGEKLKGLTVTAQVLPIMEVTDGPEFVLVLGCDGISAVTQTQAMSIVRNALRNFSGTLPASAAAKKLVCACRKSEDNNSAIVVIVNRPPAYPPPKPYEGEEKDSVSQ